MSLEITVNGTTLTDLTEDQIIVALNLKRSDYIFYEQSGGVDGVEIQNVVRNIMSNGESKLHFIGEFLSRRDINDLKDNSEAVIFFSSALRGEVVVQSGRHRVMGSKALLPFGQWQYLLADPA